MRAKEFLLDNRYRSGRRTTPYIYTNIAHATKDANEEGLKVIHNAAGYYKLADLDDPSPALVPNPHRKEETEKLKLELANLEQQLDELRSARDHRSYNLFNKIFKKIKEVKKQIRQVPAAVEKSSLLESLSHSNASKVLDKFIQFAQDRLELSELPKINFITGSDNSVKHSSFGGYGNRQINITISNRHINDICRTLAHELVHYKQDMNNELDHTSGNDGSPAENEANARAAVIMREWGKQYPQLFSAQAVE